MQLSLIFLVGLVLAFSNARTILWTNAGGNPLWNNAGNWDCQCLPTINDDVIIDISTIPGNVQIGGVIAPALAGSLTIGGTSRFAQTLVITGALTIGTGGSKLSANGRLYLSAGPDTPFINDGVFSVDGNGFYFSSGAVAGKGSFNFAATSTLNFTGPAQKTISTTFITNGKIITDTSTGTNIMVNKGGSFIVAGIFTTPRSLTIQTDSKSTVSVKGSLVFTGATLELQGTGFTMSSWYIGSQGTATIDNSITSTNLEHHGTLYLIGGPTDSRNFQTITGDGTILNLGGSNYFNSLQTGKFNATGGNVTLASASIAVFTLRGGSVYGGRINAQTAVLETGFLQGGLSLMANNLILQGTVSIVDDGTTVVVTGSGSVVAKSLITLTAGSSFVVASSATFRQTSNLQIVTGAPAAHSPIVNVFGSFVSSGWLTVSGLPINGSGFFTLTSSASWTLTNVRFTAKSVNSAGNVGLSVGSFNVDSVTGSGSYSGNPNPFVANDFSGNTFTLTSGNVHTSNVTLTTLTLNSGIFSVSGAGTIGTLNLVGGKLSGTNGSVQIPFAVGKTVISGGATQSLNNIGITTMGFSLECALKENCQLITSNSYIVTKSQ